MSASAQRNEFDIFKSDGKWYPTTVIGARLGLPIFDGFQKHNRIQQSKISLMKLNNDKKFLEQSIDLEVASARINLQNTGNSLNIQKKNIELANEVYRVSKLKYEQGVGSNLEVLTAETALKESQTNYYNALYDALVAKAEFEKATGSLIK
jgi:outer membrane protein TolC